MLKTFFLLVSMTLSYVANADMIGTLVSTDKVPMPIAQNQSPDQIFFNNHVLDIISVTPTRLTNPNVEKVFAFPIYLVKISFSNESTKMLAARKDAKLVLLPILNTDQEMPDLLALISPNFKLKTNEDASVIQNVLDTLYPVDSHFDKLSPNEIPFAQQKNQWTFVRGYFVGHKKGFIFTTKGDGSIVSIKFSLDLTNANINANVNSQDNAATVFGSIVDLSEWSRFGVNMQNCKPGAFKLPNPIIPGLIMTYTIIGLKGKDCQLNMKTPVGPGETESILLVCSIAKSDATTLSNAAKEIGSNKFAISSDDPSAKILAKSCKQQLKLLR